jgi:hypothetical protein
VAPISALDVAPPLEVVIQLHGMIGWREHHGTGHEILGRGRKIFCTRRLLREGHAMRLSYEVRKSLVGNQNLVDQERINIGGAKDERLNIGSSEPIQNSPPGINTMPGGTGPDREVVCGNPSAASSERSQTD